MTECACSTTPTTDGQGIRIRICKACLTQAANAEPGHYVRDWYRKETARVREDMRRPAYRECMDISCYIGHPHNEH